MLAALSDFAQMAVEMVSVTLWELRSRFTYSCSVVYGEVDSHSLYRIRSTHTLWSLLELRCSSQGYYR